MTRFSKRTGWDIGESSYAAAVREARSSGRQLSDLTISNPTRCGFEYDPDALLRPLIDRRALVYDPDPRGLVSARESVAQYYADHGAVISPNQLVMTTSTSEAYSYLFRLLCDPGDEVLVPQPSYPLFDFLADLDDVQLRTYPLFYDFGWWIDFAELERAITPRTRAIMVVHPNNPTGHWTAPAERNKLQELCARRGLALIVDEVFLDYPLRDETQGLSFAAGDHPALTFVLSGLSKISGLPQMKAAWIATMGPDVQQSDALARLEVIADTFLSMNAPVQLAVPSWLAGREQIGRQIRRRARQNLSTLQKIAQAEPGSLEVLRVDAGWSAVLSLPRLVGEVDGPERLVRDRGVIVHPAAFYGMPEWQRVIVSLIGPVQELEQGIRRAIRL